MKKSKTAKLFYLECRKEALALYEQGFSITDIHKMLSDTDLFPYSYWMLREYLCFDPDFIKRKPLNSRIKKITQEDIKNFKGQTK